MIRTTQLTIIPEGWHLFDNGVYTVTLDQYGNDEMFVDITENQDGAEAKIRVDAASWPELREAIDRMIGECKP